MRLQVDSLTERVGIAADGLGLTAISGAIGSFLAHLPGLVAAVLIMLVGHE